MFHWSEHELFAYARLIKKAGSLNKITDYHKVIMKDHNIDFEDYSDKVNLEVKNIL